MSMGETAMEPTVRTSAEEYGENFYPHLLAQYTMAVERAEQTAERRENGNKLFLVLLTALAAVYGIGGSASLSAMLPLMGAYISVGWLVFIWSRHKLNIGTFQVIREMERHLPARLFEAERERRFAKHGVANQIFTVSWAELVMPLLFATFYLLVLIIKLSQ